MYSVCKMESMSGDVSVMLETSNYNEAFDKAFIEYNKGSDIEIVYNLGSEEEETFNLFIH